MEEVGLAPGAPVLEADEASAVVKLLSNVDDSRAPGPLVCCVQPMGQGWISAPVCPLSQGPLCSAQHAQLHSGGRKQRCLACRTRG